MCCGQKRSALKANGASNPDVVKLLYSGRYPMNVRGSVSGRLYQFAAQNAVQPVDPRDAIAMTQTRLFRRMPWR